ncbi:MAG: tetratricopeptide repeat protein [Candidatus Lokiarchaeota archaeon]|nr:tetratricopeptide repeat protein [Candidatus Lokiarchaeota archaeon]
MSDQKELIQEVLDLKKKGEYEHALQLLRNGLELHAQSEQIKALLIKLLFEYAGFLEDDWIVDYEETLRCYQEIAELDPSSYRALYNCGISLFSLGNYDAALLQFNEALKLKPNYKYCYYNIGLVYEELNKLKKAQRAYKRALEIDRSFGYAKEALKAIEIKLEAIPDTESPPSSNIMLEKLKSLLRVSKKVKLEDLQTILGLERAALLNVVIEWAETYGFEIDGEYLLIQKKSLPKFFKNLNLEDIQ